MCVCVCMPARVCVCLCLVVLMLGHGELITGPPVRDEAAHTHTHTYTHTHTHTHKTMLLKFCNCYYFLFFFGNSKRSEKVLNFFFTKIHKDKLTDESLRHFLYNSCRCTPSNIIFSLVGHQVTRDDPRRLEQ